MTPPDTMDDVYVAVGSNIDPETNVLKAAERLKEHVVILDASTLYLSPPKTASHQPSFINGVWRIRTQFSPLPLKYEVLRQVERELGRVRTADKFAPRPIDLDLIVYGNLVVDSNELTLPDPNIYTDAHIAVPLLEMAPHLVLWDKNIPLSILTSACNRGVLTPLPSMTEKLKGVLNNG